MSKQRLVRLSPCGGPWALRVDEHEASDGLPVYSVRLDHVDGAMVPLGHDGTIRTLDGVEAEAARLVRLLGWPRRAAREVAHA